MAVPLMFAAICLCAAAGHEQAACVHRPSSGALHMCAAAAELVAAAAVPLVQLSTARGLQAAGTSTCSRRTWARHTFTGWPLALCARVRTRTRSAT